MKYLRVLAIFLVILVTDYFTEGVEHLNIYYLFVILSLSITWIIGIGILLDLILYSFKGIKTKKPSFVLDLILILLSSVYLLYINFFLFIIAWIIPVLLAIFIGIPVHIYLWKQNRK